VPDAWWTRELHQIAPALLAAAEGAPWTTPLAWSHAQYVRLAWSIDAGQPVEQPTIVAERYAGAATSP